MNSESLTEAKRRIHSEIARLYANGDSKNSSEYLNGLKRQLREIEYLEWCLSNERR